MQKVSRLLWPILLLGLLGAFMPLQPPLPAAQAQPDTCPALIAGVVETTAAACRDLPAGSVCAATQALTLTAATGETITSPPVVPLDGLASVAAGALLPDEGQWGVGVLRLPGLGSEQFTAVLFGEAELENAPGPRIAPVCSTRSLGEVNVRAQPNTASAILGQLALDEVVPVTGRLQDSSWWQIAWNGDPAWVFAELTRLECDAAALLVIDPSSGAVLGGGLPAPDFQSARLETDFSPAACADAPRAGLLAQSEGVGASWRINDVTLGFNGTLLLQAGANDVLAAYVIEGQAVLEVSGVSRAAGTGQLVRVPLREGSAAGVPGPALEYTPADAALAPLALLPRPVAAPLTAAILPAAPDGADLACAAVPQVYVSPTGEVRVLAQGEQVIRVSVAPPGSLQVRLPGAAGLQVIGDTVADVVADAEGIYIFASGAAGARFTVTCGLPVAAPPPLLQVCEAVLLRWDEASGNSVRFSAPMGAVVSVIARHGLPSQGSATTLELLNQAREQVARTPFVTLQDHVTAGPLDVRLLQNGEYIIRWDGDPFNVVSVEALCQIPFDASPPEAPAQEGPGAG